MIRYSSALLKNTPYCLYITGASPMHSHGYWEIAIFLKGLSYNYLPKNKKEQCPPGTCIIFRPEKDYHFITHEKGTLQAHLDVYISDEKMQEVCKSLNTGNEVSFYNLLLQGEKSPTFFLSNSAIVYINELLSKQDFITKSPEMDNTHLMIVTMILGEYFNSLSKISEPSPMIKKIIDLLLDHNNYDVRLEDLLKKIPYSRTYLNREFKKYTNKTPIAFFNHQKMLYASELLLTTDKTILEISNIVGFSSAKNFIEQFKKVFFCTPSAYKNSILSSSKNS